MWIIMLITVAGVLLLDFTGSIPQSSVGGPLTIFFVALLAMLAYGVYEAWSNKRGVLGWIVSIVCSFLGGIVAGLVGAEILDLILPYLRLDGPLATSHHPLRYILPAGMMVFILSGSWAALKLVNRFR
ncbi:MAG: hypothetical protein KGZ73_04365 [Rhizobiales bacterium]|nr:hypothetical protein [Hyphomicrobiales bacterium]